MDKQKNETLKQMIAGLKKAIEDSQNQPGVDGQKALNILFNELDAEGLLVDPEGEAKKALLDRVDHLEKEVGLLKDLVARSFHIDTSVVLKG